MNKTLINNSFRLHKLRQIKINMNKLVCLELEKKFLLSECPEKYKNAKVRYNNIFSRHLNVQNKLTEYNNTTSYIDFNGNKKKVTKLEEIRIQFILERLSEIVDKCTFLQKTLKSSCHSINSLKSYHEIAITYKETKAITANEIITSNEYVYIANRASRFSTENFCKIYNTTGSVKNNSCLNNSFSNCLLGVDDEIYRSKNEILASLCLKNCGLSYIIEPFYPNSSLRADFAIFCSYAQDERGRISVLKKPKQIFIEIAGAREKPEYEAKLQHKIELSGIYHIPLFVIDSTDYSLKHTQTLFDYEYLCDIFTELYFGIRKADGSIITPYKC